MKHFPSPFIAPGVSIYLEDAIKSMANFEDNSFDIAIADPPYGASTKAGWKLPKNHNLDGFGGSWKIASHTWDMLSGLDGFELSLQWLSMLKRLVKPTGSIWIHSTYHNSGIINVACQILGLEIINEVVWFKRNAFPNLAGRRLTASHETILWVHTGGKKRSYYFNYEKVKAAKFDSDRIKEPGKQLRTVWDVPNNKVREELKHGSHPTQKPLRITNRMLMVSAKERDRLLIPFVGSGTDIVAGIHFGLECVGFEVEQEYFDLACKRSKDAINHRNSVLELELVE
jgi:site-specific DNA-methyltransferase (adenine-specific)